MPYLVRWPLPQAVAAYLRRAYAVRPDLPGSAPAQNGMGSGGRGGRGGKSRSGQDELMAQILLLHSALGLRPAVLDFAERLLRVWARCSRPLTSMRVRCSTTSPRASPTGTRTRSTSTAVRALAAELPADTVLAGFSLGSWFAQRPPRPSGPMPLPRSSCTPPEHLAVTWSGVPVQVHRYAVPTRGSTPPTSPLWESP